MEPKISVIMGTYNSAKTVARAIDSVLEQTFPDFEFIICDDGSTDSTYSILKKYEKKDQRIILIKNEKNYGLSVSLNKCINLSKADIIARMDDDDISHKNRFEKQMECMVKHSDFSVIGTGRNLFDERGIWGVVKDRGERTKTDVFRGKNFAHPTVFIKKKALNNVGNYSTDIKNRRGQDYDLWCKLYLKGYKGYNMEMVLFDYYESSSSLKRRKFKHRINDFNKKKYWRKKLELPSWYLIYAYKDIIAGLIPRKVMLKFRKRKFKIKKKYGENNE